MKNEWIEIEDKVWRFTFDVPPTAFPDSEADPDVVRFLRFSVCAYPLGVNQFAGIFEIGGTRRMTPICRIAAPTLEEAKAKLTKAAAALVGELAVFVHESKGGEGEHVDRRGIHSGGLTAARVAALDGVWAPTPPRRVECWTDAKGYAAVCVRFEREVGADAVLAFLEPAFREPPVPWYIDDSWPFGRGDSPVTAFADLVSVMRAEVVALQKRKACLSPELTHELEALIEILAAADREESATS